MLAALDTPLADAPCDPLALPVEGWIYLGADQSNIVSVEALLNGVSIGSTSTPPTPYPRRPPRPFVSSATPPNPNSAAPVASPSSCTSGTAARPSRLSSIRFT